MAKKRKALLVAAAAFAASPQGRRMLSQAKEYASRPETKQRAQELLTKARTRLKGGSATPWTATGPAAARESSEGRQGAGPTG